MQISSEYNSRAYLRVTSKRPLSAITKHFGIAGEESSWSVGDNRKHAPTNQYDFSCWKMNSGLDVGLPLDNHLKALWNKMELIRLSICELPDEMCGYIQCVGHFKSHRDPWIISGGHFATAAYYQLSIDCDFYFDDDFGHENDGKPYWVWR